MVQESGRQQPVEVSASVDTPSEVLEHEEAFNQEEDIALELDRLIAEMGAHYIIMSHPGTVTRILGQLW